MLIIYFLFISKDASVRAAALSALRPVFRSKETSLKMKEFLDYFQERMIDMSDDVDEAPATIAILLFQEMLMFEKEKKIFLIIIIIYIIFYIIFVK